MNQQEQVLNRNFEIAISNLRNTEQAHFESRRDALMQEAQHAIQSEKKSILEHAERHLAEESRQFNTAYATAEGDLRTSQRAS